MHNSYYTPCQVRSGKRWAYQDIEMTIVIILNYNNINPLNYGPGQAGLKRFKHNYTMYPYKLLD